MISEQPTRKMVKLLRQAGWIPARTVGSHTVWQSPDRRHSVSVPDGHRRISPGVVRKIMRALEEER